MAKQRILLITRNFPPLTGGMEKLCFNIYSMLNDDYEIILVAPKGSDRFAEKTRRVLSVPLKPHFLFLSFCLFKVLFACVRYQPQFILSGSGLTAPIAWLAGLLLKKPTICLIHGLDIIAKNFIYQQFFVPALRRCTLVVANSMNTAQLAINKDINQHKIHIIHPGVNMSRSLTSAENFVLDGIDLHARKIMLSVGRITPRKGIFEFIDKSLPQIVREIPDALLVICGTEATDAIQKQSGLRSKILDLISERNLSRHVLFTGYVEDQTIERLYALSRVMVFPVLTLPSDIEGFGMVAIEAAAHGRPTVAFNNGGVSDAVQQNHSGFLIAPGDYQTFSRQTIELLSKPTDPMTEQRCRTFAQQFSWPNYYQQLNELIQKLE